MKYTATFENTSTMALEDDIVFAANVIQERRLLRAQGCTCDLAQGNRHLNHRKAHCTEGLVVCEERRTRWQHGAPPFKSSDLALGRDILRDMAKAS